MPDQFFAALRLDPNNRSSLMQFEIESGVSAAKLQYFNSTNTIPTGANLEAICRVARISPIYLMLKMGQLDSSLINALSNNAEAIWSVLEPDRNVSSTRTIERSTPSSIFKTSLGTLFRADCIDVMRTMDAESVDLIFADPPFNLKKEYASGIIDDLSVDDYLAWCEQWSSECVRLLKPGGSFFIWNLPRWNTHLAEYLKKFLSFRDWITVDLKYGLPIASRLYPSHYSLLYFCKGERPSVFHPDRLPMPVCPHCAQELKDYGGYKGKMNPRGINLTDVWLDIPPVRHAKYKKRKIGNELPLRLLDRVIEMASDEGDLVFDPFGGSGTTYITAEIKKRRWVGVEIGPTDDIVHRFADIDTERRYLEKIRAGYNRLFTEATVQQRKRRGLWTTDDFALEQGMPESLNTHTEQHRLFSDLDHDS